VVDQWMMPFFSFICKVSGQEPLETGHTMSQVMTTLRLARLLRILRLARLVRNIEPLYDLVVGVVQAMKGMSWVLVLTLVLLYLVAILSVRLMGQGLAMHGGQAPIAVQDAFPNIGQSMFVLFQVMNGDMEPLDQVFEAVPTTKIFAAVFIVISNWAILAIFTAVVSENMINSTETRRDEESKENARLKLERT
ncbi:unnamed protein product, partial [Polarella glacialis]